MILMFGRGRAWPAALLLPALLGLSACGAGASASTGGGSRVSAVASFYPLEYVLRAVGGDAVAVTDLTPAGAEPHDLELTPRDVAAVSDADLVVYAAGLQPAVEAAVAAQAPNRSLDASVPGRADRSYLPLDAELAGATSSPSGTQVIDPHFWLDPTRLADVGDAVAARLSDLAPADAAGFSARATALRTTLQTLDSDFRGGLASCRSRIVVTGHDAFGYLADRYDLTQVGISGLSPDSEPRPADLARIAAYVAAHDVTTVFTETLASPAVTDAVAREAGVHTAVLDPVEGITSSSAGTDYVAVMEANLRSLRAGLRCS
jgi:zinc transport system substrate-binding protein